MTTETSNARGDWVLVPREPTEAMIDAWRDAPDRWVEAYAAMLAAAPPPAAARGDVRRWHRGTDGMAVNEAGDWVLYSDHAALAAEGVQAGEVDGDAVTKPIAAMFRYSNRRIWEFTDDIASAVAGQALMESHGLHSETVYLYAAPPAASDPQQQPEARGVVDEAMIDRVLNTRMRYGQQLWWIIDRGDGTAIGPSHRAIARIVIEAYIAALTGERNG